MATARVTLPNDIDGLLRSELERCIHEACLGDIDTAVAKRYLIDKWPQIEIAAELGWTRSTVSARVPKIISKVQNTAHRMGMT